MVIVIYYSFSETNRANLIYLPKGNHKEGPQIGRQGGVVAVVAVVAALEPSEAVKGWTCAGCPLVRSLPNVCPATVTRVPLSFCSRRLRLQAFMFLSTLGGGAGCSSG